MTLDRTPARAWLAAFGVFAILFSICRSMSAEELGAANAILAAERPLVIAHRGDSSRAPENTLVAFELALRSQADLIELDYYQSADGVLVCFHDSHLDRTTDAPQRLGRQKLRIADLKARQLAMLDAGSWFDSKFRGCKIPSLEQALNAIQPGAVTLIERKQGDAASLVKLLQQKKLEREVVVQAFSWSFLRDVHRLDSSIALCALGSGEVEEARLQELGKLPVRGVGWSASHLTLPAVEVLQQRGLHVWVYTVNAENDMQRFLQWGVDGLITDRPAAARELVPLR